MFFFSRWKNCGGADHSEVTGNKREVVGEA